MAFFGHKPKRGARTTPLRPASPWLKRVTAAFQSRGQVLRLGMCLLAVVAMVAAVEGWKTSFPYRLGDVIDNGITAKVNFNRVNTFETVRAREDARDNVPYIFKNDPEALKQLPAKLRVSLSEVAEKETLDQLLPDTRAAFGLTERENDQQNQDAMNHDFSTLKAALSGEDGTTGNRIDELIAEFEKLIAPIFSTGLANPNVFQTNNLSPKRPIAVKPETGDEAPTMVSRAHVLMNELLKPTGELGKSWSQFVELGVIRDMINRWLLFQAPVTLRYDSADTQAAVTRAIDQVEDVNDVYNMGDRLLAPAQAIDVVELQVLRAEYDQMQRLVRLDQRITRLVIVFLLILVLALMIGHYVVESERPIVNNIGRLTSYLIALVLTVFLSRLLSYDPWRAEVVPLLVTVMVLAIAYNQVLAGLTGFALTLIITLSTNRDLGQFVVLTSVCAAAIIPLSSVPSRSTLIKIGFSTAVVYLFVSLGTGVVQSQSIYDPLTDQELLLRSLRGAGWCLVAGYLIAGSLPFIESFFNVVTDISLLEMSDVSHPLLQELVRRAPGTYNHSITVAAMAETAADLIGANGLLVRVGAYFHDVGKMLKPQYFVENMTEGSESRHDHLAPAMSTLIIIGHVKDGVDLARQHSLPRPLIDFIEQHHGTTLVEYFYHEAAKQADQQPDHRADVQESSFRYPGPKPQSREAGVLMIADAVESASRTLSEPTPKRIESLVHEITMKRLLDGQFDESSLTLSEIRIVEESLIKSLIAIHHGRVKYPEQRTA